MVHKRKPADAQKRAEREGIPNLLAKSVVDLSSLGLVVVDGEQRIVCWNEWMQVASGIQERSALGQPLFGLLPSLQGGRFEQTVVAALTRGMPSVLSRKFHPHIFPLYSNLEDKAKQRFMSQQVVVKPVGEQNNFCLIQVTDVSSAVARDQMLRNQANVSRIQEERTRAILASIADAVITVDSSGYIEYMNEVAERFVGRSLDDAKGKRFLDVFDILDESILGIKDPVHRCLKYGESFNTQGHEFVLIHGDGQGLPIEESIAPIKDDVGQTTGVVVVLRDVSYARKLAAKINWQATHDTLTGLVNRGTFDQQLEIMLADAAETGQVHALLYLDLDQFKIVNDTSGHVAGDELLRQVSALLKSIVRATDVLARLGGDEFGVLLRNCPEKVAVRLANQMRTAIKELRFYWGERSFSIGVSIGVVAVQPDSESVEQVLSAADTACYTAKDSGRDQVHLYQTDSGEAARRQGEMQWVTRIQEALDDDRFLLYAQAIQPILDSADTGHYEILIRMLDRESGNVIPPGAFIPAAERFDLMAQIDRWVVTKVFELIGKERERLVGGRVGFAINLSGGTISDEETLRFIGDKINEYSIPAGMISFEITETAAISKLSSANYFIRTLKRAGCLFSLDDFGSGLSSFAYLKNLPVDYLKIDGAFVRDLVDDSIDRAMVEAINQIGHVMNLKTIAEFVENDEILEELKLIGVDYAQGYGVAHPTPLADREGNLLLDLAIEPDAK